MFELFLHGLKVMNMGLFAKGYEVPTSIPMGLIAYTYHSSHS